MSDVQLPPNVPGILTRSSHIHSRLINDLKIDPTKEVILFHGTKMDVMPSVMKQGVLMEYASKGLFGRALYFAESAQKSDQYSDPNHCDLRRDEHLTLLVCRVALGRVNYFQPQHEIDPVPHGFDSTIGMLIEDNNQPSGYRQLAFREFTLIKEDQIYPQYVVIYKRVNDIGDISTIA